MKVFFAILFAALAISLAGCASDGDKPDKLPSRSTQGGDLPWGRPASWEGGLPGMGGMGTPSQY